MSSSDEIEFDPKAPAVERSGGATAVDPTAPSAASEAITEVSAAIAAGRIDASEATSLLIDRVLAEQFPGAVDLEPLRAKLAELLEGDPTLARLLRP